MSVLVVEDEDLTRKALQHWLTARDFRVSAAVDCASAIRHAVAERPQVILLDVKLLGGDDGLRLPRVLKEIGFDVPFVVFTGSGSPSAGFQAHQLGAFAVIEKPALPDQIAEALRNAVETWPSPKPTSRPGFDEVAWNPESEYVRKAVSFIERSSSLKQLSVARIAAELSVSRDHLSRLFRQEMGCSVLTYLHRTRHRHAKRLLLGSEMNMKEIAEMCGYRDATEFTRSFARMVGVSPTEYRSGSGIGPK